MMAMRLYRCLALSCLLLGASGCSFVTVNAPPSDPSERDAQAAHDCTTSVGWPVVDALYAGLGAVNLAIAASADDKVSWYAVEMDKSTGVALGITQLAVFGAGAVYGFIETSRCGTLRKEVEEQDRRGGAPAAGTRSRALKPGEEPSPGFEY
jgi:hypothetical protein